MNTGAGGSLIGRVAFLDSEGTLAAFEEPLRLRGYANESAGSFEELAARAGTEGYDVLCVATRGPATEGGIRIRDLKSGMPSTPVIAVAVEAAPQDVVTLFREGAWDVLLAPADELEFCDIVARAIAARVKGRQRSQVADELAAERARVEELKRRMGDVDPFRPIAGGSRRMTALVDTLREVARSDSTVLITGESGTGKGLVARAIHDASPRREGPFIETNCVVYSEGILHSELFGHERGAFTGAHRLKKGRFELAQGGTLFLDEIGDISPATQLLLLRILQDRTFERVGGEETIRTDVRLIAATNADLAAAMARGTFRGDLYYRLNVIPVHVPPLRERMDDVPVLATEFLRRLAEKLGRETQRFTPAALERLAEYAWPGNVRELENLVERLVVLTPGPTIDAADLPPHLLDRPAARVGPPGSLREIEADRIVDVLRRAGGNKKRAAAILGIHRATLYAKLRRLGIRDDLSRGEVSEPEVEGAAAPAGEPAGVR